MGVAIRKFRKMTLLLLVTIGWGTASGQDSLTVYATGLVNPIGMESDNLGRLWVAEQGSGGGNFDGQISIVTPDGQVHPFLVGLRSMTVEGEAESAQHIRFYQGELWIAHGLGSTTPEGYLLKVDTTGFTPGDQPLTADMVDTVADVAAFVLDQGIVAESSVYNLAAGFDGDLFLVDASANALIRRSAATGDLSIFTVFDPFPNPVPIGGPLVDVVPTGIVFDGTNLHVGALSGFPFVDSLAAVFQVDSTGQDTVLVDTLTMVVDLDTNPIDSSLTILQFGRFDPVNGIFLPNSALVLKMTDTGVDTIAAGLNQAAGLRYNMNGELFVSSLDSIIWRIGSAPTSITDRSAGVPESFVLEQNFPNPFNPETSIRFELPRDGRVSLKVYNILGQEIRTLVDAVRGAGAYEMLWDGRDNRGRSVASGSYLYEVRFNSKSVIRKMILLK